MKVVRKVKLFRTYDQVKCHMRLFIIGIFEWPLSIISTVAVLLQNTIIRFLVHLLPHSEQATIIG